MQRYGNYSAESGVEAYEMDQDSITIKFVNGWIYKYTTATTGAENIATMQQLAMNGIGLNTFINQHVKLGYEDKWQA